MFGCEVTEAGQVAKPFAEVVAAPPHGRSEVCPALPTGHTFVASEDDLKRLLRAVAAECARPLLVEVVRVDGDRLTVGVGRSRSFLTYIPADGDPPYFSVVDESADDGEICFDCNREPSFYAARNTVPFDLALEVACRFAGSAGLPLTKLVAWEEV